MRDIFFDHELERGSVTVIALMIMVVLTLLGIMAMTMTSTDILISGNYRRFKENFYVAEGGKDRELIEIGSGRYGVAMNLVAPAIVGRDDALNPNAVNGDVDESGNVVADGAFDHTTPTGDYEFDITWLGQFSLPPKSLFGSANFVAHHYVIDTYSDPGASNLFVSTRAYKVSQNTGNI